MFNMFIIHWTHYLFSNRPKAYSEFFENQHLWCRIAADYTCNYHVKDTHGHRLQSCHDYSRAWFSRVMCCLPSGRSKNIIKIILVIKQLLPVDLVFVNSRIIKVLVRVISLGLQPIASISTLIILFNITKTSSNNYL